MKKTRLTLDKLKVNSFVTAIDAEIKQTVKGGTNATVEACSLGATFCEEDSINACDPNSAANGPNCQPGTNYAGCTPFNTQTCTFNGPGCVV